MSKEVIIDIGTHKAEELRVLNGDRYYVLDTYIRWWWRLVKCKIKKVLKYSNYKTCIKDSCHISPLDMSLEHHLLCLKQIFNPINYVEDKTLVCIDPVASITEKYTSKISNHVHFMPIAILSHLEEKIESKIVKFFIATDSLSSSLHFESDKTVGEVISPAYTFKKIIENLKNLGIIEEDSKIILRMNCEGSEYGVIKGLIELDIIPLFIVGSINDVNKKYGEDTAKEMNELLDKYNIKFHFFKGSDPASWKIGFDFFGKNKVKNKGL